MKEWGLVNRLSQDVDLFKPFDGSSSTPSSDDASELAEALRTRGFDVEIVQAYDSFARLIVSYRDDSVIVDLGIDAIQIKPAISDLGPTLSLAESVGSKVAALFSRGEARDFIDFDCIVERGDFSLLQLCSLASDVDAGFTAELLSKRLASIDLFADERFEQYGLSGDALAAFRERCKRSANYLKASDYDNKDEISLALDARRLQDAGVPIIENDTVERPDVEMPVVELPNVASSANEDRENDSLDFAYSGTLDGARRASERLANAGAIVGEDVLGIEYSDTGSRGPRI